MIKSKLTQGGDGTAIPAGMVGELISNGTHSAVTLSTGANFTITSITLTAGVWDVSGAAEVITGATTTTVASAGISLANNAFSTFSGEAVTFAIISASATSTLIYPTPVRRIEVTSSTPVYLVTRSDFSGGSANTSSANSSFIRAIRIA